MTHDPERSPQAPPTPPDRGDGGGDGGDGGLFSGAYAAATYSFAAVMFLTGLAALAVIPTLPTAARDLDGVALFPLVAGCFVAASLLGGVLGGHWADRAGARRPLAAGMALAVVTLLVSGASTSIWQLAAGRFLDGLAAGMVAVAINTAIGQAYPERLRPRALALMSTCWIVPSLIGPPLAGLVVEWWSWREMFFGLAALTAVPALIVVAQLRGGSWSPEPEPEPEPKTSPAEPSATGAARPPLLVATAVSLGAALGQYGVSGWDARHLLFSVAGFALLAVFAPRLLPPGTWRAARGLPVTVLLRGLGSGVFFTLEALVPLMLVTGRDVSPPAIGLAFTGAALAWAAASWVQGRLENCPRERLVVAGALVMAAAVVTAVVGAHPSTPSPVAGSSMVVAALGMGLLAPAVTVLSLAHSPADRLGQASSAMQTSQNLGQIAVLGLASALFNAFAQGSASDTVGYATAFSLLLLPCALLALLASRARRVRAAPGR